MPFDEVGFTIPKFGSGIYRDDSPKSAEGYFIACHWVRFSKTAGDKVPRAQLIPGYEYASEDSFTGYARGLHQWGDNVGQQYAAWGTNLSAWMFYDAQIYHITPVIARGELTNPFTVTNGSPEVSVAHTAHGLTNGQYVRWPDGTSFNGITLNGDYYAVTVTTVDAYTFTAGQNATSSGSGVGGSSINYEHFLAPGNQDGTDGAGFGTGGFGGGDFGEGSDVVFYSRTWTLDNFGQNLVAAPRGGKIYSMAPAITASELVTNGDMASATGWTTGTGWSITGGQAVATVGSASLLSTQIEIEPGTFNLLYFDITRTAGTLTPQQGSTDIGTAISASGRIKRTFYNSAGGTVTLKFSKDASFGGTIDNVSVKQLLTLEAIAAHADAGCPSVVQGCMVTDRGHLLAWGVPDANGNLNLMRLQWSHQRNFLTWISTASNQAGDFDLTKGSRIVTCKQGKGQIFALTDIALYTGTYNASPTIVIEWNAAGEGCGCVGPHAAVVANGILYWWGANKQFYMYAGGMPVAIPCSLRRYAMDNLAPSQGDKVYAAYIAENNEIWWWYPDQRDGVEVSRYVIYNIQTGDWSDGLGLRKGDGTTTRYGRTSMMETRGFRFPLGLGTDGRLYFHEKGDSANGGNLDWSITTGRMDLGDGDTLIEVQGMIPDMEDQLGGYDLYIDAWMYNQASPTITSGPHAVTSATEKVDFIIQGREVAFRMEGNSSPAFWRFGEPRFLVMDTGNRF